MEHSGKTRLLGLIGSPVEHSGSPAMYNYCFETFGLDFCYLAFDIPMEKTAQAVETIRLLNMRGANVTMPLKAEVTKYLDELSPAARIIGTVNTIVNENGKLTGYITDGEGFVKNLQAIGEDVKGRKLTLLGGGGAATAIIAQAALDGAREISVFNMKDPFFPRIEENLRHIESQVPGCKMALYDLADQDALRREIESSDILTNATRVGMAPMEEQSLITDLSLLRPGLVVADTVYHPLETKLLKDAKAAGCKIAQGLGMLIWQGAAAFALYAPGYEMPVDDVRAKCFPDS